MRDAWRVAGLALLLPAVAPLYIWLREPVTGLAGSATADMAAAATGMTWGGMMFAAAVGLIAARLLDPARTDAFIARTGAALMRTGGRTFALCVAVAGFVAALVVERVIFHGQPVLIDAITQLTHARYLASGHAVAPADTLGFFRLQQSAPVAGGWISQYPPLHIALLALGSMIRAPWIIGPVMLACALFFTARAADRLMPGRAAPRAGLILAAVSPFMLAHAATFMSHTTAAACIALALYCVSRSWNAGSGFAIGAAFATRPLTGLTVGAVITAALLLRSQVPVRARLASVAALAIGALPLIAATAIYNAHYFGSPVRFGYDVALGPSAGLGFGLDPWGNTYGLKQALAYTSAELASLSLQLFEMPLPLIAIAGVYLVLQRSLAWGESLLFAVAMAPLVTHLAYWHHGLFMGPRMLNDYGIAWSIACIVALAGILRSVPARVTGTLADYSPRSFIAGAYAAGFVGVILLVPTRLGSYAAPPSRAFDAAKSAGAGTLVFVHGGWGDRASMQLAARGWRLDEVEAALRQNSTCAVQRVIDGTLARTALDLRPRATGLPERVEFPAGNGLRVVQGEPWTASCARQVGADSAGVIDPAPLLARGSLPALAATRAPLFARDLGPALNRHLLAAHTGTNAQLMIRDADGKPVLIPYEAGIRRIWKTEEL